MKERGSSEEKVNWFSMELRRIDSRNKLLFTKLGLFFVILFYWITGLVLICIGASMQMKLYDISMVLGEASSGAPVVLTIVGILIFFMSTFGAVAILKDHHGMIKVFAIMMLIIFVIEIIVGISAYAFRDKLHNNLLRSFQKILNRYGFDAEVTKGVDTLQKKFQCCGAQNYTDWLGSAFGFLTEAVPSSCCKKVERNCGVDLQAEDLVKINQQGCVDNLKTWIGNHIGVVGAVGVGIGVVQIFGIFVAYMLVKGLQENYNVM